MRAEFSYLRGDQVDGVKAAYVPELLLEYGEVVEGRWQVGCACEVGRPAVQSSQQDAPLWMCALFGNNAHMRMGIFV